MFNTIIEIKRENQGGQLNIKINLYHDNEEELNKIVKATNKFKFYDDTTITNNDGSLSYTKSTNVMTINNIAEELLDFDNNIKELEKLFIEVGAEPLVLEGYLKATDKKEYKEDMEKAGNNQNVEENTKNNNMKNVLNNLENEIKNIKKDIKVKTDNIDIFDDNSSLEEEAIFEKQIELNKRQKLYKKIKGENKNMNINDIKEKLEIVKEDLQDDTKQLNRIEIKLLDADTMDYKTYKATMTLYNRAKNNIEKDKEIIKTLEKRLLKAQEEEKKINTIQEIDFQEVNNDMVKNARLEYNIRDKKIYVYKIEKLKFIINCKNVKREEASQKLPIDEYVSFKYK